MKNETKDAWDASENVQKLFEKCRKQLSLKGCKQISLEILANTVRLYVEAIPPNI